MFQLSNRVIYQWELRHAVAFGRKIQNALGLHSLLAYRAE